GQSMPHRPVGRKPPWPYKSFIFRSCALPYHEAGRLHGTIRPSGSVHDTSAGGAFYLSYSPRHQHTSQHGPRSGLGPCPLSIRSSPPASVVGGNYSGLLGEVV